MALANSASFAVRYPSSAAVLKFSRLTGRLNFNSAKFQSRAYPAA
ncbi:hypothetical protein CAMGR0001_2197 [Campylobacter gracilis RM3268]|uniref:Uncharacterized protein n=1 Tax=Campylobacter gracilis RM3268 TaxID=553220 RepID=C8PH09_9BACT|nr:hypothetical protein CAMGR0001_2197 [Campylobacter gracilis RM3268]